MDKNIQINFIKIFLKKYFFLNNFKKDILKNILFLPNLFCLFFKDKSILSLIKNQFIFILNIIYLRKLKINIKFFNLFLLFI